MAARENDKVRSSQSSLTEISTSSSGLLLSLAGGGEVVSGGLATLSLCRPVNLLPGRVDCQQVSADLKVDDAGVGINLVDKLVPVVDQILLDISEPEVIEKPFAEKSQF